MLRTRFNVFYMKYADIRCIFNSKKQNPTFTCGKKWDLGLLSLFRLWTYVYQQLVKLLLVYSRWRIKHNVTSRVVLGERNAVAYAVETGEE